MKTTLRKSMHSKYNRFYNRYMGHNVVNINNYRLFYKSNIENVSDLIKVQNHASDTIKRMNILNF